MSQNISGLTPLRGLAALLVIIFHYHLQVAELISPEVSPVLNKFYLMVDLFFVLSGFIMYHVYGNRFEKYISFSALLEFMRARFARIYPLHLVTLGLTILVALPVLITQTEDMFFEVIYDFSAIPSQILLTQAMGTHHEATWNTPSWSISVEWWTYLLFPLLVLTLKKTGRMSRWIMASLIAVMYISIIFYFQPEFWAARWLQFNVPEGVAFPMHTVDVITGPAFLRCLAGFMLGMLVYELYRNNGVSKRFTSPYTFFGAWILLITLWHFDVLPDPLAIVVFGILIISATNTATPFSRLLNSRPLRYLGDISYSLYLVHMPLIFAFVGMRRVLVNPDPLRKMMGFAFTPWEAWLGLSMLLISTIALASLTYYYIEKPARAQLNKAFHPSGKPLLAEK